ncbi:hypothetical protein I215_11229 [Galbibacter marinus]|uniref:Uncharacterized protein n=2 Tax=Galbibacter marinus TaxID=555500 RepID=K2PSS8_9FLAO|nr:hypothetical protein I215_11229 [Galbibacter marinus]
METKNKQKRNLSKIIGFFGLLIAMLLLPQNSFAHCDSYDGPVIQDAFKALESDNVELVYKWISEDQEAEITSLFNKTLKYKNRDKEVYQLLEKHFLETLVRLHREGEGAPYTGLKPAGSTKQIIGLTDTAILEKDLPTLLNKLNKHIGKVIKEKYEKVAALYDVRDESPEKGRAYVAAYVDYTHTIEAIHAPLEHNEASHPAQRTVHKH